MADEVLGNVYEALTWIALEDHTTIVKVGETAFFEQKPKGISIKPDLTVGKDKDNPRIIIQISHTNAEGASQKKFWRNIGEFVDARLALGSRAVIANIVFDSGQKRNLATISRALFDGFLEADRAPYGANLIRLGNDLADAIKSQKVGKVGRPAFVRAMLANNKSHVATVAAFAVDLQKCLSTTSTISSGWYAAWKQVEGARPTARFPRRRVTTIRRGLGRLLPISDEAELRRLLKAVRVNSITQVPRYLIDIGACTSTSGSTGVRISDSEVLGLTRFLTDDDIAFVWRRVRASSSSLRQACAAIERVSNFPMFHALISAKMSELSTPEGMRIALLDCYADPDLVLGTRVGASNAAEQNIWLFDYIMVAIKAQSGKQQGYGYTKLADESGFRFEIAATAGVVLSPFLQRRKMLRPDILKGVATALSTRVGTLRAWIQSHEDIIAGFMLRGLFEDKVFKTAAFDPLVIRVLQRLSTAKRSKRHPTVLTEVLGKKGTATMDLLLVGTTAVAWQSASDEGVAHKCKELMGRIGMLRVARNASGGLVPSDRVKRVALVIDGTWTDAHIKRLVDAGADGVFYADEMDELAAFVK